MIAILVLIMSFTPIQCLSPFCQYLEKYNKTNGIKVLSSEIDSKNWMYMNEVRWVFTVPDGIVKMTDTTVEGIPDRNVINRFGGYKYDCYVRYQNGSNGRIVTKCTDDIQGDTESQYDPKAIIFRPSTYMANPWVLIYSQNKSFPNISCYSPKVIDTPRLVNDRTKCWKLAEIESLFLDSMEDSLKKSIEGMVEYEQGDTIYGHRIFFNRHGFPEYCTEVIDNEIDCTSNNLEPILPECFPARGPPESSKGFEIYIIGGIIGALVVILIILSLFIIQQKRKSTSSVETNESTIDTKKETIKRLTKENEALLKTLTEKQSIKQSKALLKIPQSRLTEKSSVKTPVVETKRRTATQKPKTKSPTKDQKTVSPDKTSPKTVSPDKTSSKTRSPKVKN